MKHLWAPDSPAIFKYVAWDDQQIVLIVYGLCCNSLLARNPLRSGFIKKCSINYRARRRLAPVCFLLCTVESVSHVAFTVKYHRSCVCVCVCTVRSMCQITVKFTYDKCQIYSTLRIHVVWFNYTELVNCTFKCWNSLFHREWKWNGNTLAVGIDLASCHDILSQCLNSPNQLSLDWKATIHNTRL